MTSTPGIAGTVETAAGRNRQAEDTDLANEAIRARQLLASALLTDDGCMIPASLSANGDGYVDAWVNGRRVGAHRLTFAAAVGVTTGSLSKWCDDKGRPLVIDHLCRNRACVNPTHLELVENSVNILRGCSFSAINATLDHCAQGHLFSPENTRFRATGGRRCIACQRDRDARRVRRSA